MIAAYRQTHSTTPMAWSEGRQPLLQLSNDPGELVP